MDDAASTPAENRPETIEEIQRKPIDPNDPTNVRSSFRLGVAFDCGGCKSACVNTSPALVQHILNGNRQVGLRCPTCGVANIIEPAQDLLVVPKIVMPGGGNPLNRHQRRALEVKSR